LPTSSDFNDDEVVTSVDLGPTKSFAAFDESSGTVSMADLSSAGVLTGSFTITVTLDDGQDTTTAKITINIAEAEAPEEEALIDDVATNSATTETRQNQTQSSNATSSTLTES